MVSDCDVESWRHLRKDFGLTKVFHVLELRGLIGVAHHAKVDLWSGNSDIRDPCFLLLQLPKALVFHLSNLSLMFDRPCTTPFFFGPGNGSRRTLKVLEPVSPTLPARHVFHACHLRFGVKNCIRLWHSTSFWTWSPRWFVTTPCASWVSGSRKNPDDFRLLPGKSAAVLWLLKTEDVLMKIDEYVQIVINCYIYILYSLLQLCGFNMVQPLWKANLHAHSRASRPISHPHLWRSDNESEEDEANRAREAEDEKTRQIEDSDSSKKWDDRQGGHLHFRISQWYWMYNM